MEGRVHPWAGSQPHAHLTKMGFTLLIIAKKYLKHRVWLGSQRSKDHVHIFNCRVIGKAFLSSLVEKSSNSLASWTYARWNDLQHTTSYFTTDSFLKRPRSFSVLCTVVDKFFFVCVSGEFGVQCRLNLTEILGVIKGPHSPKMHCAEIRVTRNFQNF